MSVRSPRVSKGIVLHVAPLRYGRASDTWMLFAIAPEELPQM